MRRACSPAFVIYRHGCLRGVLYQTLACFGYETRFDYVLGYPATANDT
jgi:hypothetical protein